MFCCLRMCGQLRKPTAGATRFNNSQPEVHLDAAHMGPDVILLSHQLRVTGTGGVLATAPLVQSKSYFEVKIQQNGSWSIGLGTHQTDLSRKWGGGDRESWCLCSDNATRHNDEEFRPVVAARCKQPEATNQNGILNNSVAAAAGLIAIEDLQEDLLMTTGTTEPRANEMDVGDVLIRAPQRDFPDEGDVVGVAFDHVELNFYFNGKNLEVPFRNVRGSALFPVIYVGNGAILDIILDNFTHSPPPGFERILLEQSLL
ncbi:SPRY domain-containing protein 7 isoform X1 [Drosophila tropicalis]|uniref:SPRY domain-containing protein 7 isoform X1 n=2 Tax=Drosophila tropicalis TaxID=46794 RepID=UPI0035AC15A6